MNIHAPATAVPKSTSTSKPSRLLCTVYRVLEATVAYATLICTLIYYNNGISDKTENQTAQHTYQLTDV